MKKTRKNHIAFFAFKYLLAQINSIFENRRRGMNAVVEFNPMMKRIVDLTDANLSSGNTVTITGGTVVTIDGGTQSA